MSKLDDWYDPEVYQDVILAQEVIDELRKCIRELEAEYAALLDRAERHRKTNLYMLEENERLKNQCRDKAQRIRELEEKNERLLKNNEVLQEAIIFATGNML